MACRHTPTKLGAIRCAFQWLRDSYTIAKYEYEEKDLHVVVMSVDGDLETNCTSPTQAH